MSAIVAIVGRPNVGKSTLFNRLTGKRQAIESNVAGTTRDRLYGHTKIAGVNVMLVDTGGLELNKHEGVIESNIQAQSQIAIDGADVILFVVDAKEDLTSEDFHAADLLRRSKKPVILVANKCDNSSLQDSVYNLYELGFGEPIAVTALHSYGFDAIEHAVSGEFTKLGFKANEPGAKKKGVKIAFLGRPNAGKSTFVNALFGKERVVVSEIPGTTRDASYIPFEYEDQDFTLIDTAGLRRRGKIEKGIEKYSALRTMQAVDEADVCVLFIDATEGVTNQDCHVSEYVLESKKGLIIVVNKMDQFKGEARDTMENQLIYQLRNQMAYIPWAPVVFTSGLERKNIFRVLDLTQQIDQERRREISQEELNVWLDATLVKHPPKGQRGKRRFAIESVKQCGNNPPYFKFYCDWPQIMHFSYRRYLENQLREQFGFIGTSIVMKFIRR